MGTYSVGGGPKKHTSLKESKGSSIKRGPSYRKPTTTKTSTGIAQFKTTPIKDTPKVTTSSSSIPTTSTSKPKTPTTSTPVTIQDKTSAKGPDIDIVRQVLE